MTVTRTRERSRPAPGPRVVRSHVEPRIVERRRQVADEHRRRRRRILGVVVGVVALITAAIGALYSPLLDVDRIRVEGAGGRADELASLSEIELGSPMIGVDLAEARDALRAVPGIRSARVGLEWPATVVVVVTEEVPAVQLLSGAGRSVLAETGRVLDPATVPGADALPSLTVEGDDPIAGSTEPREVTPPVLAAALTLHRMNDQIRTQVASALLDAGGDLTLQLTDGATVRFGALERLPEKLAAAESALAQVDAECRRVIDVREPSRVTVSRGCGAAPSAEDAVAGESPSRSADAAQGEDPG